MINILIINDTRENSGEAQEHCFLKEPRILQPDRKVTRRKEIMSYKSKLQSSPRKREREGEDE